MKKIFHSLIAFIMLLTMILPAYVHAGYDGNTVNSSFGIISKKEFLRSIIKIMYIDNTEVNIDKLRAEDILYISENSDLITKKLYNVNDLEKSISKREAELIFIRATINDPIIFPRAENNGLNSNNINNNISQLTSLDLDNPAIRIIIDMYNKINQPIHELNGFYAISSYSQVNFIPEFNSVSFGWSELKYNNARNTVELTMDEGDFSLPNGFSEPTKLAFKNNVSTNLMVYASQLTKLDNNKGIIEYVITDPNVKKQMIEQIANKVNLTVKDSNAVSFNGVVIDFENIKDERLSSYYNDFLKELKKKLNESNKKLYVAVHPRKYYKGYDYKTIGEIADKVILMAHDYYARDVQQLNVSDPYNNFSSIRTPLAPLDNIYDPTFDIYSALEDITNEETGIKDKSKIVLQLSFDAVQWIKDLNNNSVIRTSPSYQQIMNRINPSITEGQVTDSVEMHYDSISSSPYLYYFNSQNNTENIIWYEDNRSILSKIRLAKLFNINNFSIWRIGNIPDFPVNEKYPGNLNIWSTILKQKPVEISSTD